ncbi:MAG: HNH endonuclease [Deltaproteobacteria bacterium]|nr:HNH endonuclease [Deltaproteobacteria bacterium]
MVVVPSTGAELREERPMVVKILTPEERAVWQKLRANSRRGPGGCRLWTGHTDQRGYPLVSLDGQTHRAARVAYELHRGPIPEGYDAHHVCGCRSCVNPRHIEPMAHGPHLRLHAASGAWAGERNSQAKLREEEVLHIKMVKGMLPASTVADYFFVAESTIRAIWEGRSWRHVILGGCCEVMEETLDLLEDIQQELRERGLKQPPQIEYYITLARACAGL